VRGLPPYIGYDTVNQKLEPTSQNLEDCLIARNEQGVNIRHVRVFDKSRYQRNDPVLPLWWGEDFAFNNFGNRWVSEEDPGTGIVPAPNAVEF
jgi:hypothetical protein